MESQGEVDPSWGGRTLTVIQDDQQWSQKITHALDIADLDVLPDVAAREEGP
jgi:hypothetical protein